MSSLHVVQENKETHKPEANTRHVTFKGTELNPKPCSTTGLGQSKDEADWVVVDRMEEDFAVNTGKSDGQMSALADSTSEIQKDKRQKTIAEARRFLAVTEAKMKMKFQKASKTERLPTKTYTKCVLTIQLQEN
ncbi:MAG: hypothetical protein LQ352_003802 [Teloschistes flavicans]|nr:MAG: hypothetical protein LQ352_003802 [Teloschistes flavicans]